MAKSRRRRLRSGRLRTVLVGHGRSRGSVVWDAVSPQLGAFSELLVRLSVVELGELSSRSVERLGRIGL
jgi:hypothetical protein